MTILARLNMSDVSNLLTICQFHVFEVHGTTEVNVGTPCIKSLVGAVDALALNAVSSGSVAEYADEFVSDGVRTAV